ncbi:Ig-like domain-containing protein [Candidatus Enterococcus mansonii]|uniref:Pesticidal crystal protein Cry22Aa Ig-like domain-containing protein n=1 Tax=Candidatus Enterococcus mansonii TaxID=1834181 RepID=A0A242CH42_9ENTE|nr:Ig-like domain-containing protein [Enterococcus sp. 4G2_DIV0659]OTO09563.1 hypothetical protein A5880_000242 [Enterococcus sp. 4G2_DIV0659]
MFSQGNKTKTFVFCFLFISFFVSGSIAEKASAETINEQENFTDSMGLKPDLGTSEKSSMSEAYIQKSANWDRYKYGTFEGDLLNDGKISIRTTTIRVTKQTSYWDRYVDVIILDESGKINYASGRINVHGKETYITLKPGSLKPNTTYLLGVNERWLLTGIIADSYPLGYFQVSDGQTHTPPTIEAADRKVPLNTPFDYMEGVSAYDETGEDISNLISYSGMVNTSQEGNYLVTYSVTDKNNLTTTKTINVTVFKPEAEHLEKPTIDTVTEKDTLVTGTAVPNTSINIIIGQEKYRNTVSESGKFSIQLERAYPAGTSIEAFVENEQGNRSESVYSKVQPVQTELKKPVINEITDKDTVVTGSAEPNTQIDLIMGIDKYREKVRSDGTFSITLDQSYPAGTGVEAFITDEKGNKSESTKTIVKSANDEIGINPIYTSDSIITGKTIPNAKIEVSIENMRARIYEGTSDSKGDFVIDMNGKTYPAATQVEVTVFFPDGTKKSKKVIVYPKIPSVNTINELSRELTGTADPNATIKVSSSNGLYFIGEADASGNFRLPVRGLKQGDILSVYQTSNGIDSDVITITVQ